MDVSINNVQQVLRRTKRKNIGRKSKTAKKQLLHRIRKAARPTILSIEEISQRVTIVFPSNRQTLPNVSNNLLSTHQEIPRVNIDTRREKLLKQFHSTIWSFANIACNICMKLYYKKQVCTTKVSAMSNVDIFPSELRELNDIITCSRCANLIKKGKVPTQAYWNAMFLDEIPDVIKNLSDMEQRLLSRIIPFVKIIKLGGQFGQSGFRGQAVLFAQDVEEIPEQLPLPVTRTGIIIVCEQRENVERCRQFQVSVQNLSAALSWLIQNNPLYRNVNINLDAANFDISQICQVIGTQDDININHGNVNTFVASEVQRINKTELVEMSGNRAIIRGSMHQGQDIFSDLTRGKQCTANAAVAIAMCILHDPPSWTKNLIDTILLVGDVLYVKSVSSRKDPHIAEIDREFLSVDELHTDVEIFGNIITLFITHNENISGHLYNDNSTEGFPNLKNALNIFFQHQSYGILTANGISIAIFQFDNTFWVFDSHSRGAKGRPAANGTACMTRFPTTSSMFNMLKSTIPKSSNNNFGNQYTITSVCPRMHSNEHNTQTQPIYSRSFAVNECIENTAELNQNIETSNSNNIVIVSSVLRPIDEDIPDVQSVIENEVQDAPLYTLRRKTTNPIQMHNEIRAEELAWFFLFPKGRNGLHELLRTYPITPLDYCQARIMCQDSRFQRNDYLFYSLSVMEYYRARQNVGVCLRLRQGNNRPEGLVQNLHINMRALRGSNAYWQTACSDLIAMVRNLGPPQWFLTLSCNDLNWKDILQACLIAAGREGEDIDNLSFIEKQRLVTEHPVALSRHFMVRVHAFMRVLQNDDTLLGGKLIDFWWRVEFQNRGSPHLHMLCWNEGIPQFETPDGIALIDQVVSCTSRTGDVELNSLIARVQVHRHTSTCYKDRQHGQCRFGFPRRISDRTMLLGPDEAIRNNGRFCILKRDSTDIYINNYNPIILKLWSGNMDLQPCGNVTGIAYYIAKYTAKHEPHDVGQAVKDAISKVQRYGGDIGKQLFAVSMTILRYRQVSACECAFRLCHLKLRDSSRKVIFLNTCFPEERYRMLRYDGCNSNLYANIFDRYCLRPEYLNDLSLAEFAVTYEYVSKFNNYEEDGDIDAYGESDDNPTNKYIRLEDGTKMKRRARPAVLRTRYYTQTANREAYFYSYLVAHVSFRKEEELLEGYESAEEAFNAKRHLLRPLRTGQDIEQFRFIERELQEVIAQIVALEGGETNELSAERYEDRARCMAEGLCDYNVDFDLHDEPNERDHVISDEEFSNNVRSMNIEQSHLFSKITNHIKQDLQHQDIEPLRLFITGGAGCGKTFVLKMIEQQIKRCYAPTVDCLVKPIFVEVTALTGVAARLINGRTLHSAFFLAIEKGRPTVYRQLTGQRLEDARRKWRHIKWLIINEISMVSYEILRSVQLRLQEFKNNNELFGGVNILLFGDIMQLPPIKGSWCFKQPICFQAEPHLWRYFGLCELKANMRQQNDADFVDLLNNLRVGQINIQQYEMLLNRTYVPLINEFADGEAIRIFPTTQLVNSYNNKMIEKLAETIRIYIINARDESREPATYGQKPPNAAIPTDPNNTGGLLFTLKLAVGSRIMLRSNLKVNEGLVNGSMGVARGFEWQALRRDQLENGELPKKVFIEFDDSTIGNSLKEPNGYVAISPISVVYQGNKGYGNVERTMLPLILSWAVTVHKLQGVTVEKAVVYLGKKVFAKGQAYVALSRVRSLQGLVISEIDQRKLFQHPCDENALAELQRLRSNNTFSTMAESEFIS